MPQQIAGGPQVQCTIMGCSPDGHHLSYAANDREATDQDILLYDAKTGESRRVADYGGLYFPANWSPDGKRMLVVDVKSNTDMDIYMLDLASEEMTNATPHEG